MESSTRGLERIGHYETGVLYKNEESSVYLKMRVPLKFFFSKNQPGNAVKWQYCRKPLAQEVTNKMLLLYGQSRWQIQ